MTEDRPFNGHTALLMRVAAVLVPLSLLVSAGAAFGGWVNSQDVGDQADRIEAETLDRQEAACVASDETRVLIRQLSRDSALEVGEALIDVVPSADPETVAAFRDAMNRRLTAIVNQLPARRWDPDTETCVDVEVGE